MDHRSRFFAAVEHEPTDRPPMDFICENWMQPCLVDYLQASDYEDALVRLDVDFRLISHNELRPQYIRDESGEYTDIWGVRRKPVENEFGTYDEVTYQPWAHMTDLEQVRDYNWPSIDIFDFNSLKDRCLKHHKDYVVVFGGPGMMDLVNGISFGRGMEQLLIDIALDDPVGMALMQKRFEIIYDVAKKGLEASEGLVDVLWIGDDYGCQTGPMFSPETWDKVFRPRLQAFIDLSHKHDAKVMLHSCGSNRQLIPKWIDMGVDIYQAVQVEASGMEPNALLREFGKYITFHGMIGLQGVLPHGTPQDVKNEVKSLVEASGGSGYIVAPAHFFEPDVPMENIVALYSAIN